MSIRSSVKLVLAASALACGLAALLSHARPSGIFGTPGSDVLNGTPYNDNIYGLGGGDTITGGKGADYVEDFYGNNRYKFFLGDVPAPTGGPGRSSTDVVYGSGNDRADFYFPIKGRVYLCDYGATVTVGPYLPTIVVYDYNGGRYELHGVKYLYEITPLGPRSVNYLEAPPDPYCTPVG